MEPLAHHSLQAAMGESRKVWERFERDTRDARRSIEAVGYKQKEANKNKKEEA